MMAFKKVKEVFKRSGKRAGDVQAPEEAVRKRAIRRKLKKIGYQTEEINTVYQRKRSKNQD